MAVPSYGYNRAYHEADTPLGLGKRVLFTGILWALTCGYLLVPIERGFPPIRIVGYPVTLTMLLTAISFGIITIVSRGRIGSLFRSRYLLLQLLVVFVFFISAMISPRQSAGLFAVLNYLLTFVINYVVFRYLFSQGFRPVFHKILVTAIVTAATVGILEGLFRVYVPFYRNTFLAGDYDRMIYAMSRSEFRVLGTLGNPILYATMLVLALGFIVEIRSRLVRYTITGMVLFASLLTVSTTALILWIVVGAGLLYTSRRRVMALVLAALGVALVVSLALAWDPNGNLLHDWTNKMDFADHQNNQIRLYLIDWAWSHFLVNSDFVTITFGSGVQSLLPTIYGLGIGNVSNLDNVYFTLLLETGILGLACYLTMLGGVVFSRYKLARMSLHWWVLVSLPIVGVSFTTIYYSTFNLIWVASAAALHYDLENPRRDSGLVPSGAIVNGQA